jgi:hypothetical protein
MNIPFHMIDSLQLVYQDAYCETLWIGDIRCLYQRYKQMPKASHLIPYYYQQIEAWLCQKSHPFPIFGFIIEVPHGQPLPADDITWPHATQLIQLNALNIYQIVYVSRFNLFNHIVLKKNNQQHLQQETTIMIFQEAATAFDWIEVKHKLAQ